MQIDFVKMNGLGNDFIVINDIKNELDLSTEQVRFLCDRHKGIGADGVILVRPSDKPECSYFMHYINADGSLAEMCGNGIRCFAKYLVDWGYVNPLDGFCEVDTRAGVRTIHFEVDDDNKLSLATVDMGEPLLRSFDIPVVIETDANVSDDPVIDMPLESPWGCFSFTCVNMGNPHAVCFLDNIDDFSQELFNDGSAKSLDSLDVDLIGRFFESHKAFPEKANIEFAEIDAAGISMRVYERGCGETLACGTGACAASVAATISGRDGRNNAVNLPGGTLKIVWNADDNHVLMTGSAATSFTGTIDLNDGAYE